MLYLVFFLKKGVYYLLLSKATQTLTLLISLMLLAFFQLLVTLVLMLLLMLGCTFVNKYSLIFITTLSLVWSSAITLLIILLITSLAAFYRLPTFCLIFTLGVGSWVLLKIFFFLWKLPSWVYINRIYFSGWEAKNHELITRVDEDFQITVNLFPKEVLAD